MRELRALSVASRKSLDSVPEESNDGTEASDPSPKAIVRQEAFSQDLTNLTSHRLEEVASHTISDAASHLTEKMASPISEEAASPNSDVASKLATSEATAASKLATKSALKEAFYPPAASHKKDRHAKGRQQLNVRIANDIFQQIKEFCAKNQLPLQDFIEISASHYIEKMTSHKKEDTARKLAHDDLMIKKTHDDIIMLYSKHTGNRWKPADDRAAERFNTVDRRHVELGILNTLLNAKGKRINSFSYFIPEIEMMTSIGLTTETVGIMLQRRRDQWAGEKMKKK